MPDRKMNSSQDLLDKSTPKCRKRKRSSSTDDNSDVENESLHAIEKKLRSVAKMNNLSAVEMKKLIKKLVVNDHVLAFISLKAEDELAREKDESDKIQTAAVIINEADPSVPKLTRAKARELNKAPLIALPSLIEQKTSEIASLIQEELHSDEEDEEYMFKEDDFVSDEDPNLTASDIDSQPRTPQTPFALQESPHKFSADGVFKIPREVDTGTREDEIIATRTRSKFCLEQTTIEDIQSEFVPPDDNLDVTDTEVYGNDQDWMEFLNTFSKPLSNNLVNDDDDPVNDPEYVAAEKIPFDAEELRDVNISKKELTELVAELFEGLLNEGVCMESIELETPKKFVDNNKVDTNKSIIQDIFSNSIIENENADNKIEKDNFGSSFSSTQFNNEYFQPNVMSTPQVQSIQQNAIEPLFVNTDAPYPPKNRITNGSVSSFKISYNDSSKLNEIYLEHTPPTSNISSNISNSHWGAERYIPARKLLKYEYVNKFEKLKNSTIEEEELSKEPTGYTLNQYHILQQQLRIHIQFLAQNFFQTYSHPDLWKIAPQQKQMMTELNSLSKENATFDVCNLKPAIKLIDEWEKELEHDTEENAKLMQFIHKEMRRVSRTHNQVSRFAPRIMKQILSSPVFMYPELLPRIPFSAHQISFHMFAPSESFLIAMGLEKHLNEILANEKNFSYLKRRTPLSVACERMTNTIIHGKTPRRLRDHINELRKASTYNPVKFYYEHKRAPPAEHKIVLIDNMNILEPRQRILDLPSVWREFLQVLNAGGIIGDTYPDNYSRYIKDITGELIGFPNSESRALKNKSINWKPKNLPSENEKPSVVININYLFGQTSENPEIGSSFKNLDITADDNESVNQTEVNILNDATNTPPKENERQKKLTEYFGVVRHKLYGSHKSNTNLHKPIKRPLFRSALRLNKYSDTYISKKLQLTARKFRYAKSLQKNYENLLSAYRLNLEKQFAKYKHRGLKFIFRHCKALELYTNLLKDLKMNCKKNKQSDEISSKRKVNEEQEAPKSRKANRQEENLRHMLLPDSAEDSNRKDAIYAFNFYEKVEEVLKQSKRPEDCKKFNHILRSFDPKRDKVADLYYKLEKLFLPDHPELAHVFLTFLLPPEAAEIGKFFEHFMYTNAGTFFNKLNVYFNKQPAQIRKIYNCINELSEEPNVSVEKIKAKIFPLLKGNTFLIDWFSQLFLSETPSERLFGSVENINMKEVLNNQSGEYIETLHPNDLLDSPTESQTCQLKFINGRIFYGTKIPLPAKLSFMACSFTPDELNGVAQDEKSHTSNSGCVHGIREYGEKRLASSNDCSSDDNDKSEEDDSKASIVHSAMDEDPFETCDDATLRSHAIRLNPSYYSTSCYSTSLVSTSNNCHRPLKLPLSATEDGKGSPRKAMSKSSTISNISGGVISFKERRKSPKKNVVKSPLLACKRFTVDNHSKSNAIAAAKKLKNLIDDEPNYESEQYKKKLCKKRKDGETKLSEDSEGSDGEPIFSPGKEIKQEPLQPWTREEDKIILEEIKSGCKDQYLYERINSKMLSRTLQEIETRHKFLIDFLFKLQCSK